jgi:hypothetical protein
MLLSVKASDGLRTNENLKTKKLSGGNGNAKVKTKVLPIKPNSFLPARLRSRSSRRQNPSVEGEN